MSRCFRPSREYWKAALRVARFAPDKGTAEEREIKVNSKAFIRKLSQAKRSHPVATVQVQGA